MPQDPIEWPSYIPSKLGPNFTKEQVYELINRVLKRKMPDPEPNGMNGLLFESPWPRKPEMDYSNIDNPEHARAAYDAVKEYPEAASRIGKIYLNNDKQMHPQQAGSYSLDTNNIRIRGNDPETGKPRSYGDVKSTLRHELSHGMGLYDERDENPDAYDIGSLSDLLKHDKDIYLPSKKKKGVGPSYD